MQLLTDLDLVQALFENKTGFLPLSIVGHVDCEDPWLPKGIIPQIYSMFAQELCPPVGYTSSFQGQFIVSRQRVRARPYWTYQRLLVRHSPTHSLPASVVSKRLEARKEGHVCVQKMPPQVSDPALLDFHRGV